MNVRSDCGQCAAAAFHPVVVNDYGLFKYPDYTLPLSVKMAEVSRDYRLDVLHVHYAVRTRRPRFSRGTCFPSKGSRE